MIHRKKFRNRLKYILVVPLILTIICPLFLFSMDDTIEVQDQTSLSLGALIVSALMNLIFIIMLLLKKWITTVDLTKMFNTINSDPKNGYGSTTKKIESTLEYNLLIIEKLNQILTLLERSKQ